MTSNTPSAPAGWRSNSSKLSGKTWPSRRSEPNVAPVVSRCWCLYTGPFLRLQCHMVHHYSAVESRKSTIALVLIAVAGNGHARMFVVGIPPLTSRSRRLRRSSSPPENRPSSTKKPPKQLSALCARANTGSSASFRWNLNQRCVLIGRGGNIVLSPLFSTMALGSNPDRVLRC